MRFIGEATRCFCVRILVVLLMFTPCSFISALWDTAVGPQTNYSNELLNVIIYPQNLPNTPPEGWIALRPDLTCICSHDSITGWVTGRKLAGGSGMRYAEKRGQGIGGLYSHVEAVNAERGQKGLNSLVGLHVDDWPDGADVVGDPHVIFLEDEDEYNQDEAIYDADWDEGGMSSLMGGSPILPSSLYSSVAVGGTFDGLHYGHRKLLTLAISSVEPLNGRLMIGITEDEMLRHKAFSDRIPRLEERIEGILDFVGCLAPVSFH